MRTSLGIRRGWVRVWIALTACWILGLGGWLYGDIPRTNSFVVEYQDALNREAKERIDRISRECKTTPVTIDYSSCLKASGYKEANDRYRDQWADRNTQAAVMAERAMSIASRAFTIRAIQLLAVPPAIAFLVGLLMAWVIRGFRD